MSNYPRGSEWRRWDLHVHTPASILNNQFPKVAGGEPDWEAFVARLEATPISVLGATDYFTIDGYKRLREFKTQGRLRNISTILPNVEFRLSHVLSSKKDSAPRRLNFHVVFSDEVSPQDIEEHFLHDIKFFYQAAPQSADEVRKLKPSNLAELGRRLKAEHAAFREGGRSDLEIGAMTAVVNHEEITEILRNDSRFRGKYLLVYPEEGFALIDWDGQDHLVRKGILQKSDMVFSANVRTRSWCLGQPPYDEGAEAFVGEFQSLKPCIHGSDAHSLPEIGWPCSKRGLSGHTCTPASPDECDLRYCWLKADPTFEGLRQLLYEPAERVAIQSADPSPLKSNYTIGTFKIAPIVVNAELSIARTDVQLNEGLVAVTGGRGRGKTAFVDLIANCYMDRCKSNDPNSFARRVAADNAAVRVSVVLKNGTSLDKDVCQSSFVEDSEIVYIAQGELERYIGTGSDLNKYISNLIFESPQVKNSVTAFDFCSFADVVQGWEQELRQQHEHIQEMEESTAVSQSARIEKEGKQTKAELQDVDSKIAALAKELSEEKRVASAERQKVLTQLQARRADLVHAKRLVDAARQFLTRDLPQFARQVSEINVVLQRLGIELSVASPEYPDADKLQELSSRVDEQTRLVIGEIERREKELRALETGIQEHAKALTRREELARRLAALKTEWQSLVERRKELAAARAERDELFRRLISAVLQQRTRYAEVIGLFGSEKTKILHDLDFVAEIEFDRQGFLETAAEVLDNRQVEVYGERGAASVFADLLAKYEKTFSTGDEAGIAAIVQETARLAGSLRDKMKKARSITPASLYRALFASYSAVKPAVLYRKTPLAKLSLGQKATVLIKIYLAQGTNPILVDSHDEHLDNEFIMEELVEAIREAKRHRQVILASNNGNVVINSDAEQIVIAQRSGGEVSYISGSIENPAIRDRALKVLEGGVDAFRRRQAKYGITNQA